jgi:hypothetical protein
MKDILRGVIAVIVIAAFYFFVLPIIKLSKDKTALR